MARFVKGGTWLRASQAQSGTSLAQQQEGFQLGHLQGGFMVAIDAAVDLEGLVEGLDNLGGV